MEIVTVDQSKEFYEKSRIYPYLTALLKIPEELGTSLISIQQELQSIDSRQLLCPPSYFHVTLKEIGGLGSTVNERDLPRIKIAIEKVARSNQRFRLSFGELRIFPSVVYLSLRDGIEEIRKIHLGLIRELGAIAIRGPFEGSYDSPCDFASILDKGCRSAVASGSSDNPVRRSLNGSG